MSVDDQLLLEKGRALPPQRRAEVEDFVDFLTHREEEQRLTHSAARASEPTFKAIWDNPRGCRVRSALDDSDRAARGHRASRARCRAADTAGTGAAVDRSAAPQASRRFAPIDRRARCRCPGSSRCRWKSQRAIRIAELEALDQLHTAQAAALQILQRLWTTLQCLVIEVDHLVQQRRVAFLQ